MTCAIHPTRPNIDRIGIKYPPDQRLTKQVRSVHTMIPKMATSPNPPACRALPRINLHGTFTPRGPGSLGTIKKSPWIFKNRTTNIYKISVHDIYIYSYYTPWSLVDRFIIHNDMMFSMLYYWQSGMICCWLLWNLVYVAPPNGFTITFLTIDRTDSPGNNVGSLNLITGNSKILHFLEAGMVIIKN